MDSYIVRVYSRNDEEKVIVGVVEVVDTQKQMPFKNHAELLAIMNTVIKPGVNVAWETEMDYPCSGHRKR